MEEDKIANDAADQLSTAGFELTDEMPENVNTEPDLPQEFDIDLSASAPVEETQPQAETTEAPQGEQAVEQQSSLQEETTVEQPVVDMDTQVFSYLSEKLGSELSSIEDLQQMFQPQQAPIDERVQAIAEFVSQTGRGPEDWFRFQALNPSEMDDMTAMKVSYGTQYPDLSNEEVDMLINSKYKLDEDLYSEEEVKLSQLQLKIDANSARQGISRVRSQFAAPVQQQEQVQSPIDENWINQMRQETEALEALTFELGDSEFEFGIDDNYRNQLIDRNQNLEGYFDQYVDQDGNWDHDKFNIHQALIDNIDSITKSIYQQGLSDGQRKVVNQAANVSNETPKVGGVTQPNDNLKQQILDALGGNKGLTFR